MDLMRAVFVVLLAAAACFGQATSRSVVTQIVKAAMSPHATNWNKIPTNVLSGATDFISSVQAEYFQVAGGSLSLTQANLLEWAGWPTNILSSYSNGLTNRVSNLETNAAHTADRVAGNQTTDWLLSRSYGLTNRIAMKQTVIIESNRLEFVCSLVYARGMLFGSTVTDPAYVIKWPNPDDISTFSYTNIGLDSGWDLIYSQSKDRLYLASGFNENDGTNMFLTEINLDTLAITNVIALTNAADFACSFVPSLCTDETNLWMSARERITGNSWAAAVKYRMSDWTRVDAIILTNLESAASCRFHPPHVFIAGKVEVGAPPAWVAKLSPTNLSGWVSTNLGTDVTAQAEPDIAFVGDDMYIGMQDATGDIYRIHIPTMSTNRLDMGIEEYCFTVFYDGHYLWSGYRTTPGMLARFDPLTGDVRHYPLPTGENRPNEIASDGQRLFISLFPDSNGAGGYIPTKLTRITAPRPDDFRGYLNMNGVLIE